MRKSIRFKVVVALLFVVIGPFGVVHGQTPAPSQAPVSGMDAILNTIQGAIFNPQSAQLALQDPTIQLQRQMSQCDQSAAMNGISNVLTGANVKNSVADMIAGGITAKSSKNLAASLIMKKSADCTGATVGMNTKWDESYCSASCTAPPKNPDSCDSGASGASKIDLYVNFLNFKKDSCDSAKKRTLDMMRNAYDCKQAVLASAVSIAAGQLQNALQANQTEFGKAIQYQNEVGDQMRQIDEILGPEDPGLAGAGGAQFQGLLGIQKFLSQQLIPNLDNGGKGNFASQVAQIQSDSAANEQTLQSGRLGQVTQCMKDSTGTSGGGGYTCFDQSGAKVACSPMDYIKSQIAQAAFVTRNGILRSQGRKDLSNANTASFGALMNAIYNDLQAQQSSDKASLLTTRAMTWQDIAKKYGAQIAALSQQSGVDLQGQMNAVAGACFSSADTWLTQQKNSAASDYSKKKLEIQGRTNELTSELNKGLSSLNSAYSQTLAVLSGQAVSVDRYGCTTTDPASMLACYNQIKQNVSDLLDGNGATLTSKQITGGTMPPPYNVSGFTVPCKGVNGCVTVFQQVRTAKKRQLVAAQKQTANFVNQSNAQIKSQLSTFSAFIGQLQASVKGQFDALNGALVGMGAKPVDNPKYLSPEGLKQSQMQQAGSGGKEINVPGPFENPNSMSAVLSGMVQPSGLMDFQNNGVKDVIASAQDKLEKDKEGLEKAIEAYQNFCSSNEKVGIAKCESISSQLNNCKSTTTAGENIVETVCIMSPEGCPAGPCATLKSQYNTCLSNVATKNGATSSSGTSNGNSVSNKSN